ncbi:MAG: class II aldolase/adducin family protein [Paracoccaceae bacterium]
MDLQNKLDQRPSDFADLRNLSAEFGQNSLHIQGAGGNASVKDGDVMWIKASGTMLGDALEQDVFVPVDLPRMVTAVLSDQPNADSPAEFLVPGASDLRPSIETSLHAVFKQRVVLHTHCIHTIAHAIQNNARDLLKKRLSAFNWAFVPYAKPGANLARSVLNVLTPETDVIVLGNHGLIVAGETVDAVQSLQLTVHEALALEPLHLDGIDESALSTHIDGAYELPDDRMLHQLALSDARVAHVSQGSLYPDHVIFCGIAVTRLAPGKTTSDAEDAARQAGAPAPVCLLVPGAGLLLRTDANSGAKTMLRCLSDVIMRLPETAKLNYLTTAENFELLDWDAEKYRQVLNAE